MGSAALPAGFPPQPALCPLPYRPRNPRATSLYPLLETHFETLKRIWEERFEPRYGFWRAYWDTAVASYLDCGLFEPGFTRVFCPECRYEFLVAFSCKGRGLCPSCGAKRAALFSQLLHNKILEDVAHAQWVFTLPKMLRPYFLYHRELLGELARLAYETVREMMVAAVEKAHARPGMVAVIQTFGSSLKWNPTSTPSSPAASSSPMARGIPSLTSIPLRPSSSSGTSSSDFFETATSSPHKARAHRPALVLAELRFRRSQPDHRLSQRLRGSAQARVLSDATSGKPLPTSLSPGLPSLPLPPQSPFRSRRRGPRRPLEFLARVLIHIPEPHKHLVRFYGVYANRVRASYRGESSRPPGADSEPDEAASRSTLSKRWRELIYRFYEVDPLDCPRCGARMRILTFIIDPKVIRQILDHLKSNPRPRAPPDSSRGH